MLRDTTHRDLRTELFGHKLESPVMVAPVGVQTIFHQDKELGVAEVAADIGVPYVLSTASSSSIENVAKASGDGVRWFQLYWPQDNEITKSVSLPQLRVLGDQNPPSCSATEHMFCHCSNHRRQKPSGMGSGAGKRREIAKYRY